VSNKEAKEEKKKKWFSRRHETGEAHREAHATCLAEHGIDARQRKAEERKQVCDARSPQRAACNSGQASRTRPGSRQRKSASPGSYFEGLNHLTYICQLFETAGTNFY